MAKARTSSKKPTNGRGRKRSSIATRPQQAGAGGLSTYDPFGTMRSFVADMDRVFERFGFGPISRRGLAGGETLPLARRADWAPQMALFERGNQLVVQTDLPGMSRDDIEVEIDENNNLVISGEREYATESDEEGYYRSERSYGRFCRSVRLPQNIDESTINAQMKNGVLEITMNKPQPETSGRKIKVG